MSAASGRHALAALIVLAALPASAAAPPDADRLAVLRGQCVAAAPEVQQQEAAVVALQSDIALLRRDAGGRQRGLDESRPEQARFLATILRLARDPPERIAAASPAIGAAAPIDRIRGQLLLDGTLPALRSEGHALAAEFAQIATLRTEIAAKEAKLAPARAALGPDRDRLAPLVAQRLELTRRMLPAEPSSAAQAAKLGHDASDVADLIRRADAAADHRAADLLAHARAALPRALKDMADALTADAADPTRPSVVPAFDPPHSALTMPVAGAIAQRFGTADGASAAAKKSQGLRFAALPGGEVVAPFDGQVVFAGSYGDLGLILIIRHGGLYHTLLAGLGRADVTAGQWVIAGEPVGAMPDGADAAGAPLYFELRRNGRPVDPEPDLAKGDAAQSGQQGNRKVRE